LLIAFGDRRLGVGPRPSRPLSERLQARRLRSLARPHAGPQEAAPVKGGLSEEGGRLLRRAPSA